MNVYLHPPASQASCVSRSPQKTSKTYHNLSLHKNHHPEKRPKLSTILSRVSIFTDFFIYREMENLKSQNSREFPGNFQDPRSHITQVKPKGFHCWELCPNPNLSGLRKQKYFMHTGGPHEGQGQNKYPVYQLSSRLR